MRKERSNAAPGGKVHKAEHGERPHTGILPDADLELLAEAGELTADSGLEADQIQPASIDLRLGPTAYRLRASFLPGPGRTVAECLPGLTMHEIPLAAGAVLETGCVYLVPLQESLNLAGRHSGMANPKSSTGRIDVFTRLITDGCSAFDKVDAGYKGPLYTEICPQTFSILVRTGSRLNQLRLRRGSPRFTDTHLRRLHESEGLVEGEALIDQGLGFSVDLLGDPDTGLVGFRAKRHAGLIDVDSQDAYAVGDFWDAIEAGDPPRLILDPDEFYILMSKESVHVPPDHAAEMIPVDPLMGEFRVHYAGFFDPGFGNAEAGGVGSRAVLEVRSHDVPFALEDGQIVGRLVYEWLTRAPRRLYGQGIGSHYQAQGLKLSKHFRM